MDRDDFITHGKSSNKNRSIWKNVWFQFSISLLLVVLLFITTLYSGIFLNQEKSINHEFRSRANSLFNSIVLTRKWNAMHGGVFVEKKEGIVSNPYLKNPDIQTFDGKIYTKKNPALMTREISEIADKDGAFKFHITSLKLVNPDNRPDYFEREALLSFENGVQEVFTKEYTDNIHYYRYIAPLYVEEACLKCHYDKNYRVGDVRGGISVKFPITEAQNELKRTRLITFILFILTITLMIWLIARLIFNLYKRLSKAENKLKKLLNTDSLTGLKNRRSAVGGVYEEVERAGRYGRELSCMMIDIDFFKKLNDTYGHPAGDEVLRVVGEILKNATRESDLAGRYGGEEFIVLLPETDIKGAISAAEKIRREIENTEITVNEKTVIKITASFGISSINKTDDIPTEKKSADIVERADRALYRAKAQGRNRVCRDDSCDCTLSDLII